MFVTLTEESIDRRLECRDRVDNGTSVFCDGKAEILVNMYDDLVSYAYPINLFLVQTG